MIPNRYENISGKRNKLETKLSRDVGNSFQLEDNSTLEQLEEETIQMPVFFPLPRSKKKSK